MMERRFLGGKDVFFYGSAYYYSFEIVFNASSERGLLPVRSPPRTLPVLRSPRKLTYISKNLLYVH